MASAPNAEEADEADPPLAPAGAPIRAAEWLVPPILFLALTGAFWLFVPRWALSGPWGGFLDVAVAAAVVAAIVQAFFGYRAFRDLTDEAATRYQIAVCASLVVLGLLTVFGTLPTYLVALAFAGNRAAGLDVGVIRRAGRLLTASAWLRLSVWAGVFAVSLTLVRPLLFGIGLLPIEVFTVFLSASAPAIAGFAYRLRPEGHSFF